MTFERIRCMRDSKRLRQEEVAAFLGIKQTTYSKYELGKVSIPIESLIKLADYYQTSVDYLVGRTEQREPYP